MPAPRPSLKPRSFSTQRILCAGILLVFSFFPHLCHADTTPTPPGVVATVNGQHITLAQIETCHDVSGDSVLLGQSPSLELLRQQYDACAVSLVLDALIQQELERRQMNISPEDMETAEAQARADYPVPGDFEKELQEEYLDIPTWRTLMQRRLAAQRFQNQILRPRFSVSKEDFETYYARNQKLFQRPAQLELIWFQDANKAHVEQARAEWTPEQLASPPTTAGLATVLRISPDRLSPQLKKDVQSTKFGQATPVRQEGEVYLFVVPRKNIPAKRLSIVEAYPAIEQALIENRIEDAYLDWLEQTLHSADIRIAPMLRISEESEKKTPPPSVN